jgi:hypothetical protein
MIVETMKQALVNFNTLFANLVLVCSVACLTLSASESLNAQSGTERSHLESIDPSSMVIFEGSSFVLDKTKPFEVVFADSNIRFSLNNFALSQVLSPFPIQLGSNGEIINYTPEQWENILGRLSPRNAPSSKGFDFEAYRTQFYYTPADFINLINKNENINPLIVPPWMHAYLGQQVENNFEYFIKSQYMMGNVCIIDERTGYPAERNITKKWIPADSPNAMLAYMALFNRWLYARPEMAGQIMKENQIDYTVFSDPLKLCQLFAPGLIPDEKKTIKKNR